MSDNRKVLLAKRKGDRSKGTNNTGAYRSGQDSSISKRGIKRPLLPNDTPKKNLANDRLKRLRSSLNEDQQKECNEERKIAEGTSTSDKRPAKFIKSFHNARKRPQSNFEAPVLLKIPKQEIGSKVSVESSEYALRQNISSTAASVSLREAKSSAENIEDMEWSTTEDLSHTIIEISSSSTSTTRNDSIHDKNKNYYFIVVDTNVFLSHLETIKNIVSINISGNIKPVVYIPWIVLEELDFIKGDCNRNLKFKAQEAIKYVEKMLSIKHERMMGQTLNAANEQKSVGKSQDNKIIASCLQVLEKYHNMVLLTGDINLKNKAHFNNIPVCSHTEIMPKIMILNATKAQIVLKEMIALCSTVISECAKKAYGLVYKKMPICQSSPKSLQDCILLFTKYWFPVFEEVLMKQFKKSIDDLSKFLTRNGSIANDSSELDNLVTLCMRTCLFLKDVECCKNIIEDTIRNLNNIKQL